VRTLLVLLVMVFLLQGVSADDLSQQAETAYAKGDFQVAAKFYQQMIDSGVQNSDVYFNLGNAYYQLHDLGRSLLNYRRAEQLTPRDEDLHLNIARVRAQRVDAPNNYVAIGDQIAQWERGWLSSSESGIVISILWWGFCGFLVAYLLLKRWRQWTWWGAVMSCIIFVFIGAVSAVRVVVDSTYQPAIVISPVTSVLTGPDAKYMSIFELHAAGEVRIMERRAGWVRVQLPDLQEGWVEADAIEGV